MAACDLSIELDEPDRVYLGGGQGRRYRARHGGLCCQMFRIGAFHSLENTRSWECGR